MAFFCSLWHEKLKCLEELAEIKALLRAYNMYALCRAVFPEFKLCETKVFRGVKRVFVAFQYYENTQPIPFKVNNYCAFALSGNAFLEQVSCFPNTILKPPALKIKTVKHDSKVFVYGIKIVKAPFSCFFPQPHELFVSAFVE